MRPERLTIEGLTAFRERQEIDFRELDVFTITGPTGAGKTSIFDAMSLALFGRIPRVGTSAQVRRFISHGASEAIVVLEFLVDGRSYRVSRRYRAATSASEVTLEQLDDDGDPLELASGQRAVTSHITELVGMDYEAFQRAVLLPQGQFDLFLTGDPAERRAILVRLLDLERYVQTGRAAREQARNIGAAIAAYDDRLGALEHATTQGRRQHVLRRDAARRLVESSAEQLERARAARDAGALAIERARQLETDVEDWSRLASRARELGHEARAANTAWAAYQAEAVAARDALVTVEERLREQEHRQTAVVERVGTSEQHAAAEGEIGARRRAAERLQRVREELESARAHEAQERQALAEAACRMADRRGALDREIRQARGEEAQRARALARAQGRRSEAEREHEGLVRRHLAAGLRSEVHVGDDCPVCDRAIERPPQADVEAQANLDSARRALESVRAGESTAASALAETERSLASLDAEHDRIDAALVGVEGLFDVDPLRASAATDPDDPSVSPETLGAARAGVASAAALRDAAERRVADSERELAEVDERVMALLGTRGEPDPDVELARRRDELLSAQAALATAKVAAEAARGRRDAVLAELAGQTEADRDRLRVLGELRGRSEALLSRAQGEKGWPELRPVPWPSAAESVDNRHVEGLSACAAVLSDAATDARRAAAAAQEQLARMAADASGARVSNHDDLVGVLSSAHEVAVVALAEAERDLERLDDEIAERAKVEREREEKRRRAERLEWVASHLRDDGSGFLAFVIGESLETLCELASARLEQMSQHRYTLHADTDGSFQVIDAANGRENRDVETLSGGETFLVSFALALALSEAITNYGERHGALLEAIFIDEGFSALDSSSLEVALDALETLGHTEQRMIGLVSHVERVPERIPDGLEVIKGAGSSTVRLRRGEPIST